MRLNFSEQFDFHDDVFNLDAPPLPVLPVKLLGRRGLSLETYALLDTGADTCMFHAQWCERLGIQYRLGRPDKRGGIDPKTEIDGFVHRISVRIGDITVRCDVFFSDEMGDDYTDQLIGRETIFNRIRFGLRQRIRKTYLAREG